MTGMRHDQYSMRSLLGVVALTTILLCGFTVLDQAIAQAHQRAMLRTIRDGRVSLTTYSEFLSPVEFERLRDAAMLGK